MKDYNVQFVFSTPGLNAHVSVIVITECSLLENCIGGVKVSLLISSAVDRGFIGGVKVSLLISSAVDRGFIGGVKVSLLISSAVDHGFESRSGQTKDYEIGICYFSDKHTALRRKSKD